jgi:hypothetical protein
MAFKFLDTEGRAPFTGALWRPGDWVESSAVQPCHEGVHACRAEDVAIWIAPSMWHVELDGEIVETRHKIVAQRGRLVAPVDGYDGAMHELREISAWRCRERAVGALRSAGETALADVFDAAASLDDLVALGAACDDGTYGGRLGALAADAARFAIGGLHAQGPFVAACSAGHAAAGPAGDQDAFDAAYQDERDFQSAWLTRRLALT